jgi:hypothetical protein
MLHFIKLQRAPYPYTVLLMLLLTREPCEDVEHALGFLLGVRHFYLTMPRLVQALLPFVITPL